MEAVWCEYVVAYTTRGYGGVLTMPPDHPSRVGPPGRRYGRANTSLQDQGGRPRARQH